MYAAVSHDANDGERRTRRRLWRMSSQKYFLSSFASALESLLELATKRKATEITWWSSRANRTYAAFVGVVHLLSFTPHPRTGAAITQRGHAPSADRPPHRRARAWPVQAHPHNRRRARAFAYAEAPQAARAASRRALRAGKRAMKKRKHAPSHRTSFRISKLGA